MKRNFYVIAITLILFTLSITILVSGNAHSPLRVDYLINDIIGFIILVSLPSSFCYGYDRLKKMSFEEGFKIGFRLGIGGFIALLIILAPFFAIKYIITQSNI